MTTKYHLEGSKIVFEDRNGTMLYYIYNGDELLGFKYDNNIYYYHKNIFGDIIGILDTNYNEVVTYKYDSWGAISSIVDNSGINLGTINPFRYRSYYYDEETQLYYLNSRYYSSNLRRFISPDEIVSGQGIISNNLYLYCGNNPIDRKDEEGNAWFILSLKVGAISAVINLGFQIISNAMTGKPIFKNGKAALFDGFTSGFIAVTPLKIFSKKTKKILSIASGIGSAFISNYDTESNQLDYQGVIVDSIVNTTLFFVDDKWGIDDGENIRGVVSNKISRKRGIKALKTTARDNGINQIVNTISSVYNKKEEKQNVCTYKPYKQNKTPLPYHIFIQRASLFNTPWSSSFFSLKLGR